MMVILNYKGNIKMYITKERYQYYTNQLDEKEKQLSELIVAKNEALNNVTGMEEIPYASVRWNNEIRVIKNEIESINAMLKDAIIVERNKEIDDVIDLGDRVTVEIDDKCNTFTLVSTFMEMGEVSLASPLGKSIYKKRLGDSGEYKVDKRTVKYTIVGLENAQDIKNSEREL